MSAARTDNVVTWTEQWVVAGGGTESELAAGTGDGRGVPTIEWG